MAKSKITQLRDFPSAEELLQEKKIEAYISMLPRPIVAQIVKDVIANAKTDFKNGKEFGKSDIINAICIASDQKKRREITKVINASGIVVHTNMGRAPLSDELFEEIRKTTTGYSNLEFDLASGKRGNRGEAVESYLSILSQGESATIVNNCAAGLLLSLNTLANRKEVIISRSELVQIGGGFRIPDILKKSGAKLVEIGSTNITTLKDYKSAISDKTGLILKVHQSNFVQKGFVEEVSLKELVKLGNEKQIPVMNDLGSGVFIDTKKLLGYTEPTVQMSVRDGADITCFSGDKLLGGSQAGLLVGKEEYIQKIKKNPLFRTMRADKIVFAILEKLLSYYLDNSWQEKIKLWYMLSIPESELYKTGKAIQKRLGNPDGLSVEATKAFVGGGALPESDIPSVGIIFSDTFNANKLMNTFRNLPYPIIGRINENRFVLDLKAVEKSDYNYLEQSIQTILSK